TNRTPDVFVHDRVTGVTSRVSVDSSGAQADNLSEQIFISDDASVVNFTSFADNLVPGDSNGCADAFVYELSTGITERVSLDSDGIQAPSDCWSSGISRDGQVALLSCWDPLVPEDTNGVQDVYLRDRSIANTSLVSVASTGEQGNDTSNAAAISSDASSIA